MRQSRTASTGLRKSSNAKNSLTASKINPLKSKSKEDDYITSLQKQVYYLELEMRLMKDRELETKNKVGGYEVLFRDGVPLNEHFLALKTKYTNERDQFEKVMKDLNNTISKTELENQHLQMQIEATNNNYFDLIKKYSMSNESYTNQIFDLNGKLFNEENTLTLDYQDKDVVEKQLDVFKADNLHLVRTIEKNDLFKENEDEKKEKLKLFKKQQFDEENKKAEAKKLKLDEIEQIQQKNLRKTQIENENLDLQSKITKLDGEYHLNKAKIKELEGSQELYRKNLIEEEVKRNEELATNNRLNEDLDNLSKMNEELLKEKVMDNIGRNKIVINNEIESVGHKAEILINNYRIKEELARKLLEEKNNLNSTLMQLNTEIGENTEQEKNLRYEIVDINNSINQLEVIIVDNQDILNELIAENQRLSEENDKYVTDNKNLDIKIKEIQQKIELNSMLKDIDLNELKMLTKNNNVVNKSINDLISKWDKVQTELEKIEKSENN